MHPQTEGFASLLIRPQMTTLPGYPDFRRHGAPAAAIFEDDAYRPATLRIEGFGKESLGEWSYQDGYDPGHGRLPITSGGVVVTPPTIDIGDLDDSNAPSGVTNPDSYFVLDSVCLAFGTPDRDPANEVVADGAFRLKVDASGDLNFQSLASGSWTTVLTITSTGTIKLSSGGLLDSNGTQVLGDQQGTISDPTLVHSTASFGDVNAALDALATVAKNDLDAKRAHGLIAT